MRTTFTFDDDKQLVQLARGYVDADTRVSWKDVARRMRPTGHTAVALRQRLQTLYRTWGRYITQFPANFFTVVRRPRGRPPAVTRQLQSLSSNPAARRPQDQATPPPPELRQTPAARRPRLAGAAATQPWPAKAAVTRSARAAVALGTQPAGATPSALQTNGNDEDSCESMGDAPSTSTLLSPVRIMAEMSSSSAERAVTSMFAGVTRAAVAHAGDSPHLNVGEVLPSGVTTILRELGNVNALDVFFDIGVGLGNVVAQVVLATKVPKAIGIDVRADVHRLGVEMIARSPHGRQVHERAEFFCSDITGLHFSRMPPYAQATILFWNNILFENITVNS
ncbi:hypothetical protein PI125_g18915 [Phytophthora idaei]|nr:hypothetical protein PI125_g18915 [Phytophthora idaei]